MSNLFPETLSALVDGEADELELRRLLAALDQADENEVERLLEQWSRFNTISDSLSQYAVNASTSGASDPYHFAIAPAGFAQGITAALAEHSTDDVPQQSSPTRHTASTWRGLAVAASVAFAVVIGVQEFDRYSVQDGESLLASGKLIHSPSAVQQADFVAFQSLNTADSALALAQPVSDVSPADQLKAAEAQARLNAYFLQHANRAAKQTGQGLIPFARVANFEDQ